MGRLLTTCMLLLCLSGCVNPKQEIDNRLLEARQQTTRASKAIRTTQTHLTEAETSYKSGASPLPSITEARESLTDANEAIDAISENVVKAQKQLPNISNKESSWDWFMRQLPWMIPTALVLVVAMYFGVGKIVRPIFSGVGSAIAKSLGETDAKVETGKMTTREAIAARRGALGEKYTKSYKEQKEKLS